MSYAFIQKKKRAHELANLYKGLHPDKVYLVAWRKLCFVTCTNWQRRRSNKRNTFEQMYAFIQTCRTNQEQEIEKHCSGRIIQKGE